MILWLVVVVVVVSLVSQGSVVCAIIVSLVEVYGYDVY
nr:MAG TPA: hypothetical protein [Microviridae sp.]